jgi:biotin carboxyl carrier protein
MPQDPTGARPTRARGSTPARATAAVNARAKGPQIDARVSRDHKAISDLAEDLLPALIAKLAASGLGEIEVREGPWKARLRKPAGAARSSTHGAQHAADGHAPHPLATVRGQGDDRGRAELKPEPEELPILAASPAVGVFFPRKDLAVGMQVRAGERLGAVDVLGVREDVVAPVDGVIGTSMVEAGEAVEYGQGLVRIELPEKARGLVANGADREAAAVLGEA